MDSLVRIQEAYAVSLMSLHLCFQDFAETTSANKKRQLLIRAEEIIVDTESAIKIFRDQAILEIENQSDITSTQLATVHQGVAVAQLQLFSKAELGRLRRERQALTNSLFVQLSRIEKRLVGKVQSQERSFQARLSLAKVHIAALKETLNP